MTLLYPDFTLDRPNPSTKITDAMWWLWLRLDELEPTTELGGIYANKAHFHNTGKANLQNWPTSYSIRDLPNRSGPWWMDYASAIDWTFPEAHNGNYTRIAKYSKRLYDSMRNPSDPRLDKYVYQFFGQTDTDKTVEGWNEYREEASSSDSSHLWHIHLEILRLFCGDYWAMWAILTVLMGWTVAQWQASLIQGVDNMYCKYDKLTYNMNAETMQLKMIRCGQTIAADGKYGDATATALINVIGVAIAGDGKNYGPKQYDALDAIANGKGPKGDKGDQGPAGPAGKDGVTPTQGTFTVPEQLVTVTFQE